MKSEKKLDILGKPNIARIKQFEPYLDEREKARVNTFRLVQSRAQMIACLICISLLQKQSPGGVL